MNADDRRFEEFLGGFEPHRPRPLPPVAVVWYEWRRLAAAAVILMAAGGSLYVGLRRPWAKYADQRPTATRERGGAKRVVPVTSSVTLTRAALEERNQFDAQMNDIARRTLPRFDRADSTLGALAKE
jgi:hypothetical protein